MAGLGLHIIKNPAGTYSYVGSVPTELGEEVPASRSDVLGQRAHKGAGGELLTWRFPLFGTEDEARAFAESKGFTIAQGSTSG